MFAGPTMLPAGSVAVVILNLRDEFSNPILAQLEHAQNVNVVIVPSCQCVVRIFIEDAMLKASTM
jgi:hypothetical protein